MLIFAAPCVIGVPPNHEGSAKAGTQEDPRIPSLQLACRYLKFGVNAASGSKVNSVACVGDITNVHIGLFKSLASGQRFPRVTLVWIKARTNNAFGDGFLEEGVITDFQISQEGEMPTAEVTFRFKRLNFALAGDNSAASFDGNL
jgi:hypothetical protein